jgi:hypothetical protein
MLVPEGVLVVVLDARGRLTAAARFNATARLEPAGRLEGRAARLERGAARLEPTGRLGAADGVVTMTMEETGVGRKAGRDEQGDREAAKGKRADHGGNLREARR